MLLLLGGLCFFYTVNTWAQSSSKRGMYSEKPAQRWQDALISGNGETGIMVFGEPANERIIFNHEMLYEPIGNEEIEPPDIAKYLDETRSLIAEGKYTEATEFSLNRAKREGLKDILWTDPYHPAMVMKLNQQQHGEVTDYRRSVDFTSGEIKVSWKDSLGAWERNSFVSRSDYVVVQEIRSNDAQKINCSVSLRFQNSNEKRWSSQDGELNIAEPITLVNSNLLIYRGGYTLNERGYEAVTYVIQEGGVTSSNGDSVTIEKADHVMLLTKLQPLEKYRISMMGQIQNYLRGFILNYPKLLDRHQRIHSEMFNRVSLNLTGRADRTKSAEALIAEQKAKSGLNLELLETMFDMGRYALISSSGENPPNLMGIWNGEWRPAWSGDFTLDANINLQISAANLGNLPESIESYTRLLERIAPDWEKNAINLYGARGYLSGSRTSGRRNLNTHFSRSFPGHFWVSGAEWLLLPSFEHYLTSGDSIFLDRIYPMMKMTALFFEDFLTETDENGMYIFTPSYSPENIPLGHETATGVNATMDIATTKELLTNLIYSANILGKDADEIPKWEAMVTKLPPYLINDEGALKEWAHPDLKDNYDHRHISHLYPVWPGLEISPDGDRELFAAAKKAAELKGRGNGSAHGLAHMALIGARLKMPELVYGNLQFMMSNDYLYTSLFTSHNPGRIYNSDMLCSLPAVIMEMLAFSKPGEIELLPALSKKMLSGSIDGIKCRTFASIDHLEWNFRQGIIKADITSTKAQRIEIRNRMGIISVKVNGQTTSLNAGFGDSFYVTFRKNEQKSVEIRVE